MLMCTTFNSLLFKGSCLPPDLLKPAFERHLEKGTSSLCSWFGRMRVLIDLPNGLGLVFSARSSIKQAMSDITCLVFFFICSYIQTELQMLEPVKFTVLRNRARKILSSFVVSLKFNLILSSHFFEKTFCFFFHSECFFKMTQKFHTYKGYKVIIRGKVRNF